MISIIAKLWRSIVQLNLTILTFILRKVVKEHVARLAQKVNLICNMHIIFLKAKLTSFSLRRIVQTYFYFCYRLNLQWQHMKIGDDLIILQDMDTDDDMDTPKKFQNELISKMKNRWNLIWKWKFKDVVCNSLKLVG